MRFDLSFLSFEKPICSRFYRRAGQQFVSVIIALGLFTPALTMAQVTKPLTLQDAIELTLQKHPKLAVFAQQQKVHQGHIHRAGVTERPVIEAMVEDVMGTGGKSNINSAQSSLTISWLLQGELINSRIENAKAQSSVVDFDKEIAALDLAAETARLFVTVLVQQKRLKLAKLGEKQASQTLAIINRRIEAGKATEVERLQAKANLSRNQLMVEDKHHELKAMMYELVAQWQGEVGAYQAKGNLREIPEIKDIAAQKQKLLNHPAIKALANQQRVLNSTIALAKIKAQPQWRVSAGIKRFETTDDYGLQAGVSIPFGQDKRSEGEIIALSAKQAEQQAQSAVILRQLDTQLFVLLQEIEHSRHVINTLSQNVLPLLEKALAAAEKAYEIGQTSYIEWTGIRNQLIDTQSQLLDAYEDIHLQNIEIQRLTGVSVN